MAPYGPYTGMEGWGEPDVEEVLSHLTQIYKDRKTAVARGKAAAKTLKRFAWSEQISQLLVHVDRLTV